jgi:hypothetical protein
MKKEEENARQLKLGDKGDEDNQREEKKEKKKRNKSGERKVIFIVLIVTVLVSLGFYVVSGRRALKQVQDDDGGVKDTKSRQLLKEKKSKGFFGSAVYEF